MDACRNEAADFASGRAGLFAAQTSALPDIIHTFARQFRAWREKRVSAIQASVDTQVLGKVMIANAFLYEDYARLIIHSLGMQRAKEIQATELPAGYVEVRSGCSLF